jgi:hypothetical protein
MSNDEVEEIGQSMTANEELRLFGMCRDDEEDLLGDAEALLGRSAAEEILGVPARLLLPPVRPLLPPARPLLPPARPLMEAPSSVLLTTLLPLLVGTISRSSSKR